MSDGQQWGVLIAAKNGERPRAAGWEDKEERQQAEGVKKTQEQSH